MSIRLRIKQRLISRLLDKRKKQDPFDPTTIENYTLPEGADKYAINSYFFSCHNMDGETLMMRHAVRGEDITEVWFAYRDADGNEYICEQQHYEGAPPPTTVQCLQIEKRWLFSYDGNVINQKTKEVCAAKFEGTFTATRGMFDFSRHLPSRGMAAAIANEKWSKAYFNELKKHDQVHIEQPGRLKGTLNLGGRKIALDMSMMRDHSYGRRDWNEMNSHFWLTCMFEDGTMFNANVASWPTIKSIATGFMERGEEALGVVSAQVNCEIEDYKVPEKFSYSGELVNGEKFKLDCVLESVFLFTLDHGNYLIYEGVGTFDMNGKRGRGNLEFGFNGDPGRIVKLGCPQ